MRRVLSQHLPITLKKMEFCRFTFRFYMLGFLISSLLFFKSFNITYVNISYSIYVYLVRKGMINV